MKTKNKIFIGIAIIVTMVIGLVSYKLLNKKEEVDSEIAVSRSYTQVKEGDEKINNTNYVTFDAFYLRDLDEDGYAEKLRGTCKEIGTQDTLYMDLNVITNGTLKDAKIKINGNNFYFSTALVKDNVISKDYIGTNTKEIILNDIVNGTQKLIFGMVQSGDYTRDSSVAAAIGNDTNKYTSKNNTIILTGTHVADDGTETKISKTVTLTNDWYGTTSAILNRNYDVQKYDINSAIDEENQKVNISFRVCPEEISQKLIISCNHVEGELPLFNGYAPISVSSTSQSVKVSYNEQTRMFTADTNAVVNNRGLVTSTVSRFLSYDIKVEYPIEAYTSMGEDTISLDFPIKTYFEGYNNKEFTNPYRSNVAEKNLSVIYRKIEGKNARVDVDLGQHTYNNIYVVSKEKPLNIYNNIQTETVEDDRYTVRWHVYTGEEATESPLILKETEEEYTDKFSDKEGIYSDMLRYIDNVGIYFSNPQNMLTNDGYINVYNDETNELIHTFTKSDWNNYSASKPYLYNGGIKHVRIETSNVSLDSSLTVYNVKQIDDVLLTAEYTKDSFDKLEKIYSYLTGYLNIDGNKTKINDDVNYANYEVPYSQAKIEVTPNYMSNQETKKNSIIKIDTVNSYYNTKKWSNGVFLIKYPQEIIDVNINSVTANDSNITVTAVDTYEENGNVYTKIYTSNEIEKQVSLIINADLTADPRKTLVNKDIELYYFNPICQIYKDNNKDIYDLNSNENKEENIGYNKTSFRIIAPSNLLTSQYATNFDDTDSTIVAPKEVIVDKTEDIKNADVNINITNNYSSTISEIKIVGKIPFKGNTYQLNNSNLNSTYDTVMTQEGIRIPDKIKQYVTVYYSYNEKVTEDINSKKNGWTTQPDDMSKVKSYLIDLGEYAIPVNDTQIFSYTLQIPNNLKYNDISYSDHATYYCLDTAEGKLKTQTEPNKLGFRIASKYDLEISNFEKNSEVPIQGAAYSIKEVGTENTKSGISYLNGIATIKNLYVEKEYVIKQISTNENYIMDNTEKRIIAHVVNGRLEIEVLDGNFKDEPIIEEVESDNDKVKVSVENEIKYNLEINKTQLNTGEAIKGIRFELTDYNGKIRKYTTDLDGKLTLKLLEPNKQYTLTETDSLGHYFKEPVSFMMIRDDENNLKFNVLSGNFDALPSIDLSGKIPVVSAGISNEKIPTYSLKITNKEKDTENIIVGSQFKLSGENKDENALYTTDENGIIQISNLYQYLDGKNISGEYTLKEIYPTEGYILNEEPIEFRVIKDETNNIKFELISGKIRENIEDIQIDNLDSSNPLVTITIDSEPVFTLTKVDAETGEALEGVNFQITDMDGNDVIDANGKIVGVEELSKINFENSETYPWTQNEDGTWQSGNYNIKGSTSTLTSNEFNVTDKAKLEFEWSVSSEGAGYDYLYYKITNIDTNNSIGGTSNKIGGTSLGTQYNSLKYNKIEEELEPGKYKIEFVYRKDSSGDGGIDRGFVKNIRLINSEKGIKTDSNGKIRLSLKEGLYKAIETKPLEGYAIPDTYIGIGIGASKEAETNLKVGLESGSQKAYYQDMVDVEDGIIAVSNNGQVIKYNYDGEIVWENDKTKYEYTALTKVDDGVVLFSRKNVVKLDFNGNIVFDKKAKDGLYDIEYAIALQDGIILGDSTYQIYKYDLNGNYLWKTEFDRYYIKGLEKLDDNNFILVNSGGKIIKVNSEGNIVWQNTERTEGCASIAILDDGILSLIPDKNSIIKVDFNGNTIWEKSASKTIYSNSYVLKSKNGFSILGYNNFISFDNEGNTLVNSSNFPTFTDCLYSNDSYYCVSSAGKFIKYDLDGNLVFSNEEKSKTCYIEELEDGFIKVFDDGKLEKHDYQGNLIWQVDSGVENSSKIQIEEDAFFVLPSKSSYTPSIAKISYDGNIIKKVTLGNYTRFDIIVANDQILVITDAYSSVGVRKFDFDRNELSNKTIEGLARRENHHVTKIEDGFLISTIYGSISKVDFDGNLIWTSENGWSSYDQSNVLVAEDGFYAIGVQGSLAKFDLNGNLIWKNSEIKTIDYSSTAALTDNQNLYIATKSGYIGKIDNTGSFVFKKSTSSNEYTDIVKSGDYIYTVTTDGLVIKYNDNGDIVYTNDERNYNYQKLLSKVDDGIYAVSDSGKFVKYNYNIIEPEIPVSQNVIVKNEIARYKITTKVDGYGGKISGQDDEVYETVKYMENSIKDIIITPFDGYKVQSVKVNGKNIDFIENTDGTVILDKLISMKEDKEIIVSFVKKDTTLIIKKEDSINSNPLSNAKFNIKQIETREEPNISEIAENIIANGDTYYKINADSKVEGVLGELTANNENYYFVPNESGGYESNNKGISSSTANSYLEIDLTDYEGKYGLVINANISSQSSDYGYVTLTKSTTAPSYSSSEGRILRISGTTSYTTPKDYSTMLDGGTKYYLHLGYYKNSSTDSGEDKFTINSINLYNTISSTYNFIENEAGGYESNNIGEQNTTANSYIPIDLTDYQGKYNLIVNANISSERYDYGYATITTTTNAPAESSTKDRFIHISGTQKSKDYSIAIEGGKMYYLHLGYYKNDSSNSGEDKFTINSINLTLNQEDFIDIDVSTNSNGEAIIENLDSGRYQIIEKEAPEGYTINETPIIHDMLLGQENKVTVQNRPQVDLIVHHYIKGTSISLVSDDNIKGDLGKPYSTSPKIDLEKYQLAKKEDGSYEIPENASGIFTEDTIEVTYYYELKPLKVIVHHYIDGTEDKVSDDEIIEGAEGQNYTTSPITYPILNEKYELVEDKLPENANGIFKDSITELTYYYKVKEYNITTQVDGNGGTISGQSDNPFETVLYGENSLKDIIITPKAGYEIESIKINSEEQILPADKTSSYTLSKFRNVLEDKNIVVKFRIKRESINVINNWKDNNNASGKRPSEVKIQLFNGSNLISSNIINTAENTYVFENIPLYDENENKIEYTVVEKEVNTNDLFFYETSITKDENSNFIITNIFKVPETTKNLTITKKWEDNNNVNNRRPSQIKLQVKNGNTVVKEQIIDVTLENIQTYTFTGLTEYDESGNEKEYTIDEVEVNENDLKFYSKSIDNDSYIVTNTFTVPEDKITLNITKKWEDNLNENNTRPTQIKLQVKNGDIVVQEKFVDVAEENEKVYTFTDLAKYGENGQEIIYTVDEVEVNENDLIGYIKNIDGMNITNTIKTYEIITGTQNDGGTITDKKEIVSHNGTSKEDIVITPNEGYEISKILINDAEQELPENKDTEYILDKFKNVVENIDIKVEFKKIEYKITTEVDGIGGTISGQEDNPYEVVLHGEDNIKDIIITPNKGYKISSITVNGTEIEFTPNEDRTYTLDKFINITEDKHVVAVFENTETSIVVKHQTEDGTNLIEPETINGIVGDKYTTNEKDFDEYELNTMPDNANGEMTEEQIEVIYVYSLVKGKATITKVDKNDSSKVLSGATFKIEKLDNSGNVDTLFIAQEKTTGENGIVEFTELSVGKYKITEIQAPEGYELSQKVTNIEISKEQKEINIIANNRQKLELPATGGLSTIILTIIGITLIIIAKKLKKVNE